MEGSSVIRQFEDNWCMTQPTKLRTFLWYKNGMQEALNFYKQTFGEQMEVAEEILTAEHLFTAEFSIFGHEFIGMNTPGGETFNSSISLALGVDGQEEVDRIWEAITREGAPGRCGWCTDKWGVSWQVIPFQMRGFLGHLDRSKAEQNLGAMMQMSKIQLSEFVE